MKTILIAEDDAKLNDGIMMALKHPDITFRQCFSCMEIRAALKIEIPNLLILDVNFPDGSGLSILKEIKNNKLPVRIILLTANNMELDIVTGLEWGADDYITKPFNLMVLRARVNVQMRNSSAGPETVNAISSYENERYFFDFHKMIFKVNNNSVELSKTEQKLLSVLVENRGITVRREALIDTVWDGDIEFVDSHALTVSIKRLRDKLGDPVDGQEYIKTVYGIGYTWAVK